MSEGLEVICIGMAVADILVRGVSTIPENGVTINVDDISVCSGGDAVNEAITLRRLGHRVALFSLVGEDLLGAFITGECEKSGIDVSGLGKTTEYPTATSVVLINSLGERSFLSQPTSALDAFCVTKDHVDQIKPGLRVLSVGSLFCGKNMQNEALASALRRAKEVGAVTIADFVLSPHDEGLDSIGYLLELLDYVAPSRDEACAYAETEDLDQIADKFLAYGVKNTVIKLGREGVFVRTATDRFQIAAYPACVIDTTGAGDNFVAGFAAGLARGESLRQCAMIGVATASIAVQSVGATTGVKSFEQVLDVIKRHEVTPE